MGIDPGDIVQVNRKIGSNRYFFVEAFCLGGEDQRDVVSLIPADDRALPACRNADGEWEHPEVHHVPLSLFEAAVSAENVEVHERFEAMENPVYS